MSLLRSQKTGFHGNIMEMETFDMSGSNIVDDISNLFRFSDGKRDFEDDSSMVGHFPEFCPHPIGINIMQVSEALWHQQEVGKNILLHLRPSSFYIKLCDIGIQ